MLNERHDIPSTPAELPEEMLDSVAGGKGQPVFYKELSPEGTIACRPANAPLTTGAGGTFTIIGTCSPSGEG